MSDVLRYCDPRVVLRDQGPSGLSGLGVARARTAAWKKPVELTPTAMAALGFPYEPRSFLGTASDERVDRYKDVVVQRGGVFEDFRANPVMFWNHNRRFSLPVDDPPIGSVLGIWTEDNRGTDALPRTRTIRHFTNQTDKADEIYRLFKAGILRTTSIGFKPLKAEKIRGENDEPAGVRFLSWDLREESVVNMPANVGATNETKGLFEDGEIIREIGQVPLYLEEVESWLDTVKLDDTIEIIPGVKHLADRTLRSGFEDCYRGLRNHKPMVDTLLEKVESLEAQLKALKTDGSPSGNPGDDAAETVVVSIV